MIDQLQAGSSLDSLPGSEHNSNIRVMAISSAALGGPSATPTMQLIVFIQNMPFTFLVDSGSTHTFLDYSYKLVFHGVTPMPSVSVKVVGGTLLQC